MYISPVKKKPKFYFKKYKILTYSRNRFALTLNFFIRLCVILAEKI